MKDLPELLPQLAFDGSTYEPERDHERLKGQLRRVYELMRDGRWRTLEQITDHVGGSQASVSARLRDFRKAKYGSRIVERQRVSNGWFEYRVRT